MADEEQQPPPPPDQEQQQSSPSDASSGQQSNALNFPLSPNQPLPQVQQADDQQAQAQQFINFLPGNTLDYAGYSQQEVPPMPDLQLPMPEPQQGAEPIQLQQPELPQVQQNQQAPPNQQQAPPNQQQAPPQQNQAPPNQQQAPPQQNREKPHPVPSSTPTSQEQQQVDEPDDEQEQEEIDVCQGLLDNDSFHGMVPMADLTDLLKTNGQYLVRSDEANQEGRKILLSVYWNGAVKNYEARGAANQGVTFDMINIKPTILELIDFHRTSFIPVSAEGVLLNKPVKLQAWELRRENINRTTKLGEGAFGEVYRGTLKFKLTGQLIDVAIKVPKVKMGADIVGEAMKEARIQKDYIHPNVVRLFGVSAEIDPIMIVLEFVGGGSLDMYLKRHIGKLTPEHKAMMCFDVSCGLSYLHSRSCIHRDIAARNCLMDIKYGIIKISDFGLSSVGNVQVVDRSKPAPIRWLAPEVLKTANYIKASDVWSLAITYWEIYSNCVEFPYKGFTLQEVQRKLCSEKDFHPNMPPITQQDVRQVALRCWNSDPTQRPSSEQCTTALLRYAAKERYMRIPGLYQQKAPPNAKKGKRKQRQRESSQGLNVPSSASFKAKSSKGSVKTPPINIKNSSGSVKSKSKTPSSRKSSSGMGAGMGGTKEAIRQKNTSSSANKKAGSRTLTEKRVSKKNTKQSKKK